MNGLTLPQPVPPLRLHHPVDEGRKPRRRALTESELRAVPSPRWEHDPWTQRGGCTLLVGPPGSFKSTLLAALLGASATGGVSYGIRAQREGAVYAVVGEDLAGWNARWSAWRLGTGIQVDVSLPLHTFAHSTNLFSGENFADLIADVEAVNPIVIGLDPLSDLISGADENSAKDMGKVRDLATLPAGVL